METPATADCIFCKIASGHIPCYKIWGNSNFVAFLSIFPEVTGMTIVIPKKHYGSYVFKEGREVVCNLIEACREVADILDKKLDGCLRTKLVFEGIEVPHLHAKLLPMYKDVEENRHPEKATDKDLKFILEKLHL